MYRSGIPSWSIGALVYQKKAPARRAIPATRSNLFIEKRIY
jgi:hypothetical protein